jgi:L-aminopeptidase/D-esterase-like protein
MWQATVGHATIISGDGQLRGRQGAGAHGLTVLLPAARHAQKPSFGGWFSLNSNGEMTGATWVEDRGFLEGPVSSPTRTASAWCATRTSRRLKAGHPTLRVLVGVAQSREDLGRLPQRLTACT